MSRVTVIVGQTGKTKLLYDKAWAFRATGGYSIEMPSWKDRFPAYKWALSGKSFSQSDKLGFFFDNYDAGLNHRLFRNVVKTLLHEVVHPIYLVVYTLDMIDTLLDEVPHEDLTFVRVQLDGTTVEANAEEVAIIRESWGGDIR